MNILTILTRNEADFLRLNLAHHLGWGFDHVAVADNESTDATQDVLRDFGDAVTVEVIRDPNEKFDAFRRLLRRVEARHGEARWVAHSDSDEFWWRAGFDLRSYLRSVPSNVLGVNAEQKLFLPTELDPAEGPVMCRRQYRTSGSDSPLHTSYVRGKSLYRASWMRDAVLDDSHRSSGIAAGDWITLPVPMVHHYMIDGEDSFVHKVASQLRWSPSLRAVIAERRAMRDDEAARAKFRGFKRTWVDVYATTGEAGLRAYYRSTYVVSAQALPGHLARGDLILDHGFADFTRARS